MLADVEERDSILISDVLDTVGMLKSGWFRVRRNDFGRQCTVWLNISIKRFTVVMDMMYYGSSTWRRRVVAFLWWKFRILMPFKILIGLVVFLGYRIPLLTCKFISTILHIRYTHFQIQETPDSFIAKNTCIKIYATITNRSLGLFMMVCYVCYSTRQS